MTQNNFEQEGSFFSDILFVLRRNIILFILVIVLTLGVGVAYSYMKKPTYVAKEKVVYTAQNIEMNETTYNVNAMRAYTMTIVDFCDEGVVVDRANYYYIQFKDRQRQNAEAGQKYTITDYIEEIKSDDDKYSHENYTDKMRENPYIVKKNISLGGIKNDDVKEIIQFTFEVGYKDQNTLDAVEKVKLLVLAADREAKASFEVGGKEQMQYFDSVYVDIKDLGTLPISMPSNKRTIVLFGVVGVALALVAVYVKNLLDNTIKTKEDLERLTGVDLLASIDKVEEK
jgi:capsular polysaccharide biosynthesis protein